MLYTWTNTCIPRTYLTMAGYNSLTNCINFIHKDDAGLMISCVVEHFSNEPSTFSNVLVNNSARYYLKIHIGYKNIVQTKL